MFVYRILQMDEDEGENILNPDDFITGVRLQGNFVNWLKVKLECLVAEGQFFFGKITAKPPKQ